MKDTILQERLTMERYNLFCYSEDYENTIPKKGYEKHWKEINEKIEILEDMIDKKEKLLKEISHLTESYNENEVEIILKFLINTKLISEKNTEK